MYDYSYRCNRWGLLGGKFKPSSAAVGPFQLYRHSSPSDEERTKQSFREYCIMLHCLMHSYYGALQKLT
eukprot:scaffold150559_cov20-Prasinocladus_malaysianus.AAC.1